MSAQPGTFLSLETAELTPAEFDVYISLIREALDLAGREQTPETIKRLTEIKPHVERFIDALQRDNAYIPEPHVSGYSMPGGGRLMGKF
jgi:hypothetical protein